MRLLIEKGDGAELFKNCLFELDFIATDRVPRDDEGNISDVTPVCEKSSVYTENVIGMVGVNASGKTTALNIIRFILGYMSGPYLMRRITPEDGENGTSPVYLVRVLREGFLLPYRIGVGAH